VSWRLIDVLIGAAAGLVVAPLATVLAERSPLRSEEAEKFTVSSHCRSCRAPLPAAATIPFVSRLTTKGRCPSCRVSIPWSETAVELASVVVGAITVASVRNQGVSWLATIGLMLFALVLVPMSVFDLRTKSIATRLVYPAAAVVGALLVGAALIDGDTEQAKIVGLSGVAASAFIWFLFIVYPAGMGDGDARLALLLGLALGWFGWRHVVVGIFSGFLVGAVVGVIWAVASRKGLRSTIPFGPWLAIGAWLTVIFAARIDTALFY
jgi:leader peptidase (prepilin peptidase) / N-methyltransferase